MNMNNLTDEQKKLIEVGQKTKDQQRRQTAKTRILVRKAREAGITVTDDEVDEFIRKNK
jgi:hypothetical protein